MIRILTVCTGNICRSPFAELYLQSELDRISPGSFTLRSAGTHALVGHGMDERSSMRLGEIGVASDDFVARQLDETILSYIDLVLALSDEHRNRIVAMNPRLLKRTYTIREFAAVLDEVAALPAGSLPTGSEPAVVEMRWAALLKAAPLVRHGARVKAEGQLDVMDPYRQSDAVYDRMVDDLLPALKAIIEFEYRQATG
ncbi:low molecular weight phosphatase family protein [Paeniglutamicibacter antarcticus]|uniref:Low molecular weight phosphatase family protein n=1 Tax=Paeniglutamicibacter antarcticus TaxID=494023 RepID=A0ABP9TPX5_9MICC